MSLHADPLTGRLIAGDALAGLERFRAAGGRPFHAYSIQEVRELYEQGCAANGLVGDPLTKVLDIVVDGFTVRLYEPRLHSEPAPVVLFFHGGGWVMGSLSTHDGLCRRLATLTGIPVVAVDYRLAPEHPYPAAITDGRTALNWLFKAGRDHGLDATKVVLAGDSAGGQLASVLAIENAKTANPLPVAAQVLIYPVVDLTMSAPSYARVIEGFPLVADTMAWFADHYLPAGVDRSRSDVSPALGELPAGLPPTYIITVENDPLSGEGARFAAALAQSGTEVLYQHLVGYAHGLFTSAGLISRGEQAIEEISAFIRSHAS